MVLFLVIICFVDNMFKMVMLVFVLVLFGLREMVCLEGFEFLINGFGSYYFIWLSYRCVWCVLLWCGWMFGVWWMCSIVELGGCLVRCWLWVWLVVFCVWGMFKFVFDMWGYGRWL